MNILNNQFVYINNVNIHQTTQDPGIHPDKLDIEFGKIILQLEFATWMKNLDELCELEKIEFDNLVNYHRQ